MLISVHLPKTAGQSFKRSLMAHFEKGLVRDTGERPEALFPLERNLFSVRRLLRNDLPSHEGLGCIHGHFMPLKYLRIEALKGATFVTWMRDPVERIASQFHFVKKGYKPEKMPPLYRRVFEEDWSFERFCFAPENRNLYAQYLWGFPLERFDFIGVMERYDEDLRYFSERFLGREVPSFMVNVNWDRTDDVYVRDPALRRRLEAFHDEDMRLYGRALEMRRVRAGSPSAVR